MEAERREKTGEMVRMTEAEVVYVAVEEKGKPISIEDNEQ